MQYERGVLLSRVGGGRLRGNPVEHDDSVGEVRRHDEVVLHHERRLLGVEDVPAGRNTPESDGGVGEVRGEVGEDVQRRVVTS